MNRSFPDLGVPADIASVLAETGRTNPFPIQAATIPSAMAGRDLCGKAPTGSGKTLAFAVPVAALVEKAEPKRPRALILTPTRELANQIREEIEPLARVRGRGAVAIYGGTNIKRDADRLRRGVDIVVGTPGRLADLVRRNFLHLDAVDLVVVDEADRMADMGFLPEVQRLLDRTSPDRQTLLFSATLDGDVDVLVRRYQRDPDRHAIDTPAEEIGDVTHLFWRAEKHDRRRVTADIVRTVEPAIVFTRTKRGADRLAKQLGSDGIRTAAIHGNRSQNQRERALEQFADGRITTLVATDVAARGIHVDDVGIVVHYDLPATDKDYVHRSGRTGRAGAKGVVVSLVPGADVGSARSIQRSLELPTEVTQVRLADLSSGAARSRPRDERRERPRAEDGSTNGSPKRRDGRRDKATSGTNGRSGGTVKWYDPRKGYGFILPDQGGRDLFVHASGIGDGASALQDGQQVLFDVVPGRRGPQASDVVPA